MIRGLVFDFDGLMVDTEAPALESWVEIYKDYGCDFPVALWSLNLGGSGKEFDACAYLIEQIGQSLDSSIIRARRWKRKLELVEGQPLLPGVNAYIIAAKELGLRLGVASSNTHEWVAGHLERLGVLNLFDTIVTANDVTHVKPDPEIYLTAVARLEVEPEQAVALEDAPNGLLAASRAGLFCVAIPNPLTRELPLDHADLLLTSLADVPLEELLAMVVARRHEMSNGSARS